MKRVAVQPSLQYKQVETKDSIPPKKSVLKKKKEEEKEDYEELMEEGSNRKP